MNTEYKIKRFETLKIKYRSILCHLEDYRVHLPKQIYKIDKKIIKDLNNKS